LSLLPQRPERQRPASPILRFTPTAWAKLLYFCHRGNTEIGGFGLTRADDLLLIEDFLTVQQRVSAITVEFDDVAVADLFEAQVDKGRKPEQFCRLWLHTHPGDSPNPSSVDEATFRRSFGNCDWAIMFILARGGKTYARLRFNVGPGGQAEIPVEVDYRTAFGAADPAAWEAEYRANIFAESEAWSIAELTRPAPSVRSTVQQPLADDLLADFEAMEPAERQFVLDELTDRPDLWGEECEVLRD
jgi:hypothetical protein